MCTLWPDALDSSLPRPFKLIKASLSYTHVIHLLRDKPILLSAQYEIDGFRYEVMIDTGATISCIPEHGKIAQRSQYKSTRANVLVEMAGGSTETMDRKITANIKPACKNCSYKATTFLIQKGRTDILGYEALIGLKELKLFDLQFRIVRGKFTIYCSKTAIGWETRRKDQSCASARVVQPGKANQKNGPSKIISKYRAVFSGLDQNAIKGPAMRILTTHQRPVFAKQRRYSLQEIKEMKTHIDSLLKQGIIEPSNSGYAANSRIIPKKNGTGRLVINYIPLNAITYRDSFALPNVGDILAAIQGHQFFSTMDCTKGFYQINVDPRDRHKTAFSSPIGNYQFRRCPFGARNSCAAFQAAMTRAFYGGLYSKCVVYVDDILVFGRTLEEHNENLGWVLQKCAENNIKINMEKCIFGQRQVPYLGFKISGDALSPLMEKTDELARLQAPSNKKELRAVIGKLNFYSRFIPEYSRKLEPLRSLLIKNNEFKWSQYQQQAFEALIANLTKVEDLMLEPQCSEKVIVLKLLSESIEVVLTRKDGGLIMRASRLLTPSETTYSKVEKQVVALVFAIEKFKLLVKPGKFKVQPQDRSLEKVLKMVNKPERIENWLLKMPVGFDEFEFQTDPNVPEEITKDQDTHIAEEVFYIDGACRNNGKSNCQASWAVCAEYCDGIEEHGYVDKDPSNQAAEVTAAIKACEIARKRGFKCITIVTDSKYLYNAATTWIEQWRRNEWKDHRNKPVVHRQLFESLVETQKGLRIRWVHVKGHSTNLGNLRADTLARALLSAKTAKLYALSVSGEDLQPSSEELERLRRSVRSREAERLVEEGDKIYYLDDKLSIGNQKRVYVPETSRPLLMNLGHDDPMYGGHLGITKTHRKLLRFWWPKMYRDVVDYIKSCPVCQQFKNPVGLPPGHMHPIAISEVFEHLHIDIVGPLRTTDRGNCYIVTATDAYSKWAFGYACPNARTDELISFLDDRVMAVHGCPKSIITDRGSQFTSAKWKEYVTRLGVEHKMTTPYHPQSNGIDERFNGTLVRVLRSYVEENQRDWDEKLKWAVYLYNTTVHNSTGFSPYQVLFGLDPRSPLKPPREEPTDEILNPPMSRNDIRQRVNTQIRDAQRIQKKYYDTHRRAANWHYGQFVMHRAHTTPVGSSRKLASNWLGPDIIIGFVGSQTDPKAVKILDLETLTKRTLAVNDIKAYVTPDVSSCRSPNEGADSCMTGGETRRTTGTADNSYVDLDVDCQCDDPVESRQPGDIHVDEAACVFPSVSLSGPLTSSPKKVSISNDIEERFYDPGESIEQASGASGGILDEVKVREQRSENRPTQSPHEPLPSGEGTGQPSGARDPLTPPPPPPRARASGIPRLLRGRPSSTTLAEAPDESVDELVREFTDVRTGPRSGPKRA